jgi:hypothetical protein
VSRLRCRVFGHVMRGPYYTQAEKCERECSCTRDGCDYKMPPYEAHDSGARRIRTPTDASANAYGAAKRRPTLTNTCGANPPTRGTTRASSFTSVAAAARKRRFLSGTRGASHAAGRRSRASTHASANAVNSPNRATSTSGTFWMCRGRASLPIRWAHFTQSTRR